MHVDEYIDIEGLKQLFSKDRLYKGVLKYDLNEKALFLKGMDGATELMTIFPSHTLCNRSMSFSPQDIDDI